MYYNRPLFLIEALLIFIKIEHISLLKWLPSHKIIFYKYHFKIHPSLLKVFVAHLFLFTLVIYIFFPVIVHQQEQNSFRVLNVQNYVPEV